MANEMVSNGSEDQHEEVLMSPFSPERWEADLEEQRRRKKKEQFHSNIPMETVPQKAVAVVESERPHVNEGFIKRREDFLERQQDEKIQGISLVTPIPPHLYPVLKFPEKKKAPTCTVLGEKSAPVTHYGVAVPFWPVP